MVTKLFRAAPNGSPFWLSLMAIPYGYPLWLSLMAPPNDLLLTRVLTITFYLSSGRLLLFRSFCQILHNTTHLDKGIRQRSRLTTKPIIYFPHRYNVYFPSTYKKRQETHFFSEAKIIRFFSCENLNPFHISNDIDSACIISFKMEYLKLRWVASELLGP